MAEKTPNYPSNTLKGDTAAYHQLLAPHRRVISPGDHIKPFSEIDRLLAWYYHPKRAFR